MVEVRVTLGEIREKLEEAIKAGEDEVKFGKIKVKVEGVQDIIYALETNDKEDDYLVQFTK